MKYMGEDYSPHPLPLLPIQGEGVWFNMEWITGAIT